MNNVVPIKNNDDEKQEITLVVTTESFWHSVGRDLSTVVIWGGPIVINELTIKSGFVSFLLGMCLFIYIASRLVREVKKRVIRGKTVDDVVAKLRVKLQQEDFQ